MQILTFSKPALKALIYGVLISGVLPSFSVSAIELSDLVADSISAHPQVKEKVHVYRQVLRDQDIAESGWKPSIDVEATTGLYDTESPATGNTSVDYNSSTVELSMTQNLFNGYDTTHQIEQTKSRSVAALYELYDTADNIALDTVQDYLNVLKQLRLYELATENVDSHESILARIRERNSSGVGRASQLQQTEGRVARAHASLIAQQNNLQDSETALHQSLGRYINPEDLVVPELPALPAKSLNDLIDQALLDHPALEVSKFNIMASQSDYQRSKSSNYPEVDLRLASEWGDDIGGVSGDTKDLSLVLSLNYNFYNGGAEKAEQNKKISIVYEQKEFAARVRRQIINTLRLAWVADESLTRQLKFLKEHIVKSRETVESYREEFFIGQRDLVDLLDAENELNTSQNQYEEALYDAMAARYRIYEAIGKLFESLMIEPTLSHDNLILARIDANQFDKLPLPNDEDKDKTIDIVDHCDNSLQLSTVNIYGCLNDADVAMGYEPRNSAPVPGDDELVVEINSVLAISPVSLMENDTDEDGDLLTIVDVGKPESGKLAFNKNKNIIYRPNEGFVGVDKFTYTVADDKGGAATATVILNIVSNGIDLSKKQYVNFVYGETDLTDHSKQKILKILSSVRGADNLFIRIKAHTDSVASKGFNYALSISRANALKELLINEGIQESSILAEGLGESEPIADNATEAGRAINRRGEFIFFAEGVQQE